MDAKNCGMTMIYITETKIGDNGYKFIIRKDDKTKLNRPVSSYPVPSVLRSHLLFSFRSDHSWHCGDVHDLPFGQVLASEEPVVADAVGDVAFIFSVAVAVGSSAEPELVAVPRHPETPICKPSRHAAPILARNSRLFISYHLNSGNLFSHRSQPLHVHDNMYGHE